MARIPSIETRCSRPSRPSLLSRPIVSPFGTSKQGAWLDLQLGLWRALAEKVKTWGLENGLGAANRGCRSYGPARQLP